LRAGLVPHTVDGVGDGLLTALAATDPDLIIARLNLPQPGPDLPPHPSTLDALYHHLQHEHGRVPEPGMMAQLLGTRIDLIEPDGVVRGRREFTSVMFGVLSLGWVRARSSIRRGNRLV
jgi:hypothetical protein